ncbi:amino acid permease [Ruegeria hyattellae]|uniref:amino acid permease n=1 Tax=Ruegeria hyattellae TaxID=3233337 RepID=UPI00355BAC3B
MSDFVPSDSDQPRATERAGSSGSYGVWTCTALVVGNIVGSGFFLAPAALAPYGAVALIAWGVVSIGALCLGLVFARLSRIAPETGGPYAYVRLGFGDFAGFLVAWLYWISIWISLPAIALGATDYLHFFFPALQGKTYANSALAMAMILAVGLLNLKGTKEVGMVQLIIVSVKLVPFLAVAFIGLFWVDWSHFAPINPTPMSFFMAFAATTPFIMYAFIGLETATVPAGEVRNPRRTIAIATIAGVLLAAALYTFGTMSVMGVMSRTALEQSNAPFADAAEVMWGNWAGYMVAAAAILSSIAALNGWTLVMAQVPLAAARHGLLPRAFAELSANGVPAKGILISMSLSIVVLLLQSTGSKTLLAAYEFIIQLSIVTDMAPYVFCCVVEGLILMSLGRRIGFLRPLTYLPVAIIGFGFSMLTIFGAGAEPVMWAFLLMLAGLPVYVTIRLRRSDPEL